MASPAAMLPETAVGPPVWPPQQMNAHPISITLVHSLSKTCEQFALNSELEDTCVIVAHMQRSWPLQVHSIWVDYSQGIPNYHGWQRPLTGMFGCLESGRDHVINVSKI
eukprot:7311370-Pyramimonas_sp.AAC.1